MSDLLYCYNKGCGKKYLQSENTEKACQYHPGGPIFHDALKGWSCCKKRSTDFTEFLNIPGCTFGWHSNVKPEIENSKPKIQEIEIEDNKPKEIISKKADPIERPNESEPMLLLEISVSDLLKQALDEKLKNLLVIDHMENDDSQKVLKGSPCKNKGCTKTYNDESSDLEICIYHPGVPVFHEGMKYWSCCQIKTSDFNAFLSQTGCQTGRHLWIKQDDDCEKKVGCRLDWHQTASFVTISIFAKLASPPKSHVEANKVKISIRIFFDGDKSFFSKDFTLKGIIDPTKSNVKMMPSKVEINLKKLEPGSWSALEF